MKKEEKKISYKEIEEKAKKLSEELNDDVHIIYFDTPDDGQIIGFIQEPELVTKMRALDLCTIGRFTDAAEIVIETSLLKEHSDPRLLDKSKKNSKIYLGGLMRAQELVSFYKTQAKKN